MTYRIFAQYNFDTGISQMWVDSQAGGVIDSTSQADPGEDISTFAFRQAGGNTSMVIDNLNVSVVPAPGVLALLGVAGLAARRRRRG